MILDSIHATKTKKYCSLKYIVIRGFVIRGFDYSRLVNYAQNLLSAYISLAYLWILNILMAIMDNKMPKQLYLIICGFNICGISDDVTLANNEGRLYVNELCPKGESKNNERMKNKL